MGGWLIAVALFAVGFLVLAAAFTGFKNGDVLAGVGALKSAATDPLPKAKS
jgi:hypothetical protein